MSARRTNRGALPHRTIVPRPGELEEPSAPAGTTPPLTPLLYVDAKTFAFQWPVLVCPTCTSPALHLTRVGIGRRDDYDVVAQETVVTWGAERFDWSQLELIDDARGDSLVLELRCELDDHVAIVELARHKGLMPVRVTRL